MEVWSFVSHWKRHGLPVCAAWFAGKANRKPQFAGLPAILTHAHIFRSVEFPCRQNEKGTLSCWFPNIKTTYQERSNIPTIMMPHTMRVDSRKPKKRKLNTGGALCVSVYVVSPCKKNTAGRAADHVSHSNTTARACLLQALKLSGYSQPS